MPSDSDSPESPKTDTPEPRLDEESWPKDCPDGYCSCCQTKLRQMLDPTSEVYVWACGPCGRIMEFPGPATPEGGEPDLNVVLAGLLDIHDHADCRSCRDVAQKAHCLLTSPPPAPTREQVADLVAQMCPLRYIDSVREHYIQTWTDEWMALLSGVPTEEAT